MDEDPGRFTATTRTEQPRVSVGVIDHRDLVREGVVGIATTAEDVDLAWTVPDIATAFGVTQRQRVDVILLDVDLGGTSFEGDLSRIRRSSPQVRIIGIVINGPLWNSRTSDHGLLDGAVSISSPRGEWLRAIGASSREPSTNARWISASGMATALTTRESEVLQLVSLARSNRSIAISLGIAESTVKRHVSSILAKLTVRSRAEAVLMARHLRFIT